MIKKILVALILVAGVGTVVSYSNSGSSRDLSSSVIGTVNNSTAVESMKKDTKPLENSSPAPKKVKVPVPKKRAAAPAPVTTERPQAIETVAEPTPAPAPLVGEEVRLHNQAPSLPAPPLPTSTVAPEAHPVPEPVSEKTPQAEPIETAPEVSTPPTSAGECCKYCSKGKACGDSCISRSYTCHKAPGCACDS